MGGFVVSSSDDSCYSQSKSEQSLHIVVPAVQDAHLEYQFRNSQPFPLECGTETKVGAEWWAVQECTASSWASLRCAHRALPIGMCLILTPRSRIQWSSSLPDCSTAGMCVLTKPPFQSKCIRSIILGQFFIFVVYILLKRSVYYLQPPGSSQLWTNSIGNLNTSFLFLQGDLAGQAYSSSIRPAQLIDVSIQMSLIFK